MGLDRKVSIDILLTTLINLSKKVRGIVFIPLITKLLGAEVYGVYFQVLVVATLFTGVFKLGLPSALVHYSQDLDNKNNRGELYYSLTFVALISGGIIAIVLTFIAPYVSRYTLGTEAYSTVFRVGAVLVPIYVVREMSQNYFRAKRQIKRFSLLDGFKTYSVVGLVVAVLIFFERNLMGVLTAIITVEILFVLGLQIIIYTEVGVHQPSLRKFRTYLRYSIPMMVTTFSGNLQSRADRLLIGFYLGPLAVGVYSIAYTVAQLIRTLILPLRITLLPELSHLLSNGQRSECRDLITVSSKYFLTIAIPSVFGLHLISDKLLRILSTQRVVENSQGIVLILSIGIFFWGLEIIYRQLLNASEKTSLVSQVRLIGSFLNILLNVLLILHFGILGAAIATLVSYMFTFGGVYYLTRSEFDTQFDYRLTASALGSAFTMVVVVSILPVESLVGMIVIAPVIYFLTLFLIGGIDRTELTAIFSMLRG